MVLSQLAFTLRFRRIPRSSLATVPLTSLAIAFHFARGKTTDAGEVVLAIESMLLVPFS